MNKTLKNRVIKALKEFSKTYEQIAQNQKKSGYAAAANTATVRKIQLDSLVNDVQATIKEAPPVAKKKPAKKAKKGG